MQGSVFAALAGRWPIRSGHTLVDWNWGRYAALDRPAKHNYQIQFRISTGRSLVISLASHYIGTLLYLIQPL